MSGSSSRILGVGLVFSIFGLKKNRNTKTGLEIDIPFLVTDRSYRYLYSRPVYINLIIYINMSIIVNKLQYINSCCQLKYGLLIRKSLDAMR